MMDIKIKGSAAPGAVTHIGTAPNSARTAYKVVLTEFMSADHLDAVLAKIALKDPNQTPEAWETVKARLRL
jgi:hypothetical protein